MLLFTSCFLKCSCALVAPSRSSCSCFLLATLWDHLQYLYWHVIRLDILSTTLNLSILSLSFTGWWSTFSFFISIDVRDLTSYTWGLGKLSRRTGKSTEKIPEADAGIGVLYTRCYLVRGDEQGAGCSSSMTKGPLVMKREFWSRDRVGLWKNA